MDGGRPDSDWLVSPIAIARGASIGRAPSSSPAAMSVPSRWSAPAPWAPAMFPHALVVGNPARSIGWVCVCGERDSTGRPASPEPPTAGLDLACQSCDRRYAYGRGDSRLRELRPLMTPAFGHDPDAQPDIGPERSPPSVPAPGCSPGPPCADLEERFAAFIGRSASAVSNGTVALMRIRGLPDSDLVTRSSRSATRSTPRSVRFFTGATPVFVDIEPDTTPHGRKSAEAAITSRTRRSARSTCSGLPADMDKIVAIADRHGLTAVEDACQAHGAVPRPKVGVSGTAHSACTAPRT